MLSMKSSSSQGSALPFLWWLCFLGTGALAQDDIYYKVFEDLRECAPPFCGGYFLSALNRNETECADGFLQESCYVGAFNFSSTRLDREETDAFLDAVGEGGVVLGSYLRDAYPGIDPNPEIADLLVVAGWSPFETVGPPVTSKCDCSDSEVCIDDPSDDCFGCDCPVVCRSATPICGGIAGLPCPSPLTCIPDPECDPSVITDCLGLCVSQSETFALCGGFLRSQGQQSQQCALGEECYDLPRDLCDSWTNPRRPCRGFCGQTVGATCGGFAAIPCGAGLVCVDPLNDGCDNGCGGADCSGICIPEEELK